MLSLSVYRFFIGKIWENVQKFVEKVQKIGKSFKPRSKNLSNLASFLNRKENFEYWMVRGLITVKINCSMFFYFHNEKKC